MPVGVYTGAQTSIGNGVTTVFPYGWKVLDQTHIEVKVDGVVKVLGADYSVSGVGGSAGGNITFVVAPANLAVVQRARKVPYVRTVDYQANGDLKEETVDTDLDITEMQVQQLAADIARSFKAPLSVTADQVLSDAMWAARPNKVFGFAADGTPTLFDSSSAVTVSGNVTYTTRGGVATTVGAFLDDPRFYSTARANGEQFYGESGETLYVLSNDVVETSALGIGVDYAPGAVYTGIKFVATANVNFIQGLALRVKKTAGLTDQSSLNISLYTDVAGVPTALLSSGGQIFGGQCGLAFAEISATLQNVSIPLVPGATYWAIITRSETGGTFKFDSAAGAGKTYEGAGLGALADTAKVAYVKVMARSEYAIHAIGQHTHAGWFVSNTGVGVRGDSTGHYGGYFQSTASYGARGLSVYSDGLYGSSTYGNGVTGTTAAAAAHGVVGSNTAVAGGFGGGSFSSVSGPGLLASTTETANGALQRAIRAFQGIQFGPIGTSIADAAAVPVAGQYFAPDVLWNTTPTARGGAAFWKCVTSGVPGNWAAVNLSGCSADRGNAAVALVVNADHETQFFSTPITVDRSVELSKVGAYNGAMFHIVREATATGAFNLNVKNGIAGPTIKAMGVAGSGFLFKFDGADWKQTTF